MHWSMLGLLTHDTELPSLQGTEPLLLPLPALVLGWLVSIATVSIPRHLAPVLWAGVKLRRPV